uniref:Uncharacterized protein n=1 Tax=Amphimedon queenslandica TaxID=400682 RepID=A0A1X7UWG0_AMPQE
MSVNLHLLMLMPLKEQVQEYIDKHSIVESTTLIPGVVSHEEVPESLIPSNDRDCAGLSRLVSHVTIDDSSEQEAVPIEPVMAKFYGKHARRNITAYAVTITTLLGSYYT